MFHALRYAVTFPSNGVSLSGQLSLQPGSTAISGANGAGKSFIAEMLRYGLFGKKALRGPASDYKTLDMELTFSVGDTTYRVARGKKELIESDEPLAVGADAVNKKILEILGFDLEVFDVVCAANQKESERLTRLTPARRKELIDDVVGLTRQETIEKACREEAKGLAREAEALIRTLVLPEKPDKPKGYHQSAKIADELRETKELIELRSKLQRVIDAVPPEPVKPPKACPDIKALEAHEKRRIASEAHRMAVHRQLASMQEPAYTLEEIEQAEALAAYDADMEKRGPRPDYTQAQLDEFSLILDAKDAVANRGEAVICPECEHEFHPGLDSLHGRRTAGRSCG